MKFRIKVKGHKIFEAIVNGIKEGLKGAGDFIADTVTTREADKLPEGTNLEAEQKNWKEVNIKIGPLRKPKIRLMIRKEICHWTKMLYGRQSSSRTMARMIKIDKGEIKRVIEQSKPGIRDRIKESLRNALRRRPKNAI